MRQKIHKKKSGQLLLLMQICLFSFLISGFATFASAQPAAIELTPEEQAYLDNKKELSFVCDPDWPPYEQIIDKKQYEGIAADCLQLFSQRIGIPFKRIPTRSWLESMAIAKSGQSDFVSMLNNTPERNRYLDFTTAYFTSPMVIVGKGKHWLENGFSDLKGKTVAVIDGYWFTEFLRVNHPQMPTLRLQSVHEALEAVEEDRAYAVVTTAMEAAYQIRHNHLSDLHIVGQTQFRNNLSIGVRKDDAILLSIMQKAVDTLTEQELDDIREKWLASDIEELPTNYTKKLLLPGFLVLVLLAGIYLYRKLY